MADDTATNKVQVVVTDANGNPVAGVLVSFSAPSPAYFTVSNYTTDVNGVATAALASPAQGSVAVSAEANGSRRQVNVMFAALSLTVKATDIIGELEVGQTLEGQYSFSTNGNNTTDNSTFVWSGGGQSGVTTQTYKLNASDVGKILTFSVTARTAIKEVTVTGNTDSISTDKASGLSGGDSNGSNKGVVIDPEATPSAENLNISGRLAVGVLLEGSYEFKPNGGDTTDKSTYRWLDGGQSGITTTTYTLNDKDVGKILTFEVTPVNGKGKSGTAVSISTDKAAGVSGGDGKNPGGVIDPAAKPVVKATNITGPLEVGGRLEGVYTFSANGADGRDMSTFAWRDGGQSGITTQTYELNASDIGKILTFSVTAVNGAGVTGNTDSISTKDAAGISGGSGENRGEVIDPTIAPAAKDLNITGTLEVGQMLTGSYTFVANGGDTNNHSTLLWTGGGQGRIAGTSYTLNDKDVGKILTFEVTPVNGKGMKGTPVSINTKDAAGTHGSGSGKNPGEVIDPKAKPIAEDLNISGPLEVGQTLTGSYTFNPNGGDTNNRSTVSWSGRGSPSTGMDYAIVAADTGSILTFTVTPVNGKDVKGTSVSISTADATSVTGGGERGGEIINPRAVPLAENLGIGGTLAVGEKLTGSYKFNPNGGDATDRSTLVWSSGSVQRQTGVAMNGVAKDEYIIVAGDVGRILTFTVTPTNGKNVTGTPVSVNTRDAGTGGGDSVNKGAVIDKNAKPKVTADNITGNLEVGQELEGHYTFDANGGDSGNKSTFAWSGGGQSGITTRTYELNASDVGKILTFSVTAVNGAGETGNTASISTEDARLGSGVRVGVVIDPDATPSAELLDISGLLEVGQTLEGSYAFNPNGGDATDRSTLAWSSGGVQRQSGVAMKKYTIVAGDVGNILTFQVTPVNGKGRSGTAVSISTDKAAGVSGGDSNSGHKGEVINKDAIPSAEQLNISGILEVNRDLTGSYKFNPNGGDTDDRSTLAWSGGGQSGVTTKVYTLVAGDVGNILTFEVTPVNGKGVQGDSVSTTTSVAAGVTGGDAEHKGMVIDPAAPSAKLSVLKSGTQSITADGVSEAVLTFVLKNAGNDAITGLGNNVVFDVAGATASLSGVSEAPPGTYTAKLTGTQAGTADVSVKVNGQVVAVPVVQIMLTAGTPDGAHSVLKANPESIVANKGNSEAGLSTVTLTLKDTQDNLVTGLTDVNLTVAGVTGTTLTKVTESPAGSGVYTATLSGTTAGTATVTASAGGTVLSGPQAQVTLTADITTATVSTVTESTGGAKADNVSTNTLTATVKDANGNPVPNGTVDWNVTTGIATLNSATSVTDGNGQAVMTVKDTTAETATVSAKVGSNAADSGRATDTVFSLYPVVSGITQGVNNSPADDVTVNTLTVQIADMAGNALANQAVTLSVSSTGSATLKHGATVLTATDSLTATTDGKGQLLLEATDVTSESVTVSASVNNGSAAQTQTSAFGLYPVLGTLEVGQNEALANNTDVNRYVATVTDKKGNVLADTPVTLTFSLDSTTAMADGMESPWTVPTDGNGRISVPVKNSVPETVTMTAYIQGNGTDVKTAEAFWTKHYEVTGVLVNGAKYDRVPSAALVGAHFSVEINNDPDVAKELDWHTDSPGLELVSPGTYKIVDAVSPGQAFKITGTPPAGIHGNAVEHTGSWTSTVRRTAPVLFNREFSWDHPTTTCREMTGRDERGRALTFTEIGYLPDRHRGTSGTLTDMWGNLNGFPGLSSQARYVAPIVGTYVADPVLGAGLDTRNYAVFTAASKALLPTHGYQHVLYGPIGSTADLIRVYGGGPGVYESTTGDAYPYNFYRPTDAESYYCVE
ncbi:Ig-like domain-containing protein [Salmonella enterica]